MNKFVKYFLLFTLPVFVLGALSEFLLRRIPNEYLLKESFLDKNSDSLKVLFLGNSHAYYDINPAEFSVNSFNASCPSQTLEYDYAILKDYEFTWRNLECIAIPVSYPSLFTRLKSDTEHWRIKNYNIYYGMNTGSGLADYSEVLGNKPDVNWKRIHAYYFRGKTYVNCSSLGWGTNYTSKKKRDLFETGKSAAKRHKRNVDKNFDENVGILKSIIEFARDRGIKIFLYTPPAYRTYVENLNSTQLNRTIHTLTNMNDEYENVAYVNFLSDTSFSEIDFFDADHLNEIGAKKFTDTIDSLINGKRQDAWGLTTFRGN